jgi:hypothetical protein
MVAPAAGGGAGSQSVESGNQASPGRLAVWDSDAVYARYQKLAIDHSRRPEIDRDRLLTRFLEVISGW